jgi:hypothetical protein
MPAARRIPSLRESRRAQTRRTCRNAGFLLEPRASGLLRSGQDEGADRDGDAARIADLHKVEARVRGRSAADRLAVRQAESKPLVTELRTWFEVQIAKLPARGPTADAIRYALNHWDGLVRFLEDGRIGLDNNSVERAMRPVCLSMFWGESLKVPHSER